MRAIHIDAVNKKIHEVELPDDESGARLSIMQAKVGGYIDMGWMDKNNNDTLFVDDEGLLKPIQGAFKIDGLTFAGNGLVCGFDPKTGATIEVKSTLLEIALKVSWGMIIPKGGG